MSNTQITIRKTAILGGASLVGAIAGVVGAKLLVSKFAGSLPVWELSAIVVGALAGLVIAALFVPIFIRERSASKGDPRPPR